MRKIEATPDRTTVASIVPSYAAAARALGVSESTVRAAARRIGVKPWQGILFRRGGHYPVRMGNWH